MADTNLEIMPTMCDLLLMGHVWPLRLNEV